MKQSESASRRWREAAKECREALTKVERVDQRVEEVIAQTTACRAHIIDNFLEYTSLPAPEIGHAEALRRVRSVLERVSPGLSCKDVEEGVAALSQEEAATPREDTVAAQAEAPKDGDHPPVPGHLEG